MKWLKIGFCVAIVLSAIAAFQGHSIGDIEGTLMWYWYDAAQLDPATGVAGAAVSVWNWLMEFEAVRIGYLFVLAGVICAPTVQLAAAIGQRNRDIELDVYRRMVVSDHAKLQQDIQRTCAQLEQLMDESQKAPEETTPEWFKQAQADPNAALSEFRRQIEYKLRTTAGRCDPDLAKRDLNGIMKGLEERKVLTDFQAQILSALRRELNAAVHVGIDDAQTQKLLLGMAPEVLTYLDGLAEKGP